MTDEFVTVLDLGSTRALALSATVGSQGSLKVRGIASIESRGVKKGVVTNVEEAGRTVDALMRRLQQQIQGPIGKLVVGVSGAHVEGMSAQGFKPIVPKSRTITRQDVLEVVNHSRSILFPPDREQIQAIPREFRVDEQRNVKRPVGVTGAKLEILTYLVSGQIKHIQDLERAFTLGGHNIEQMVLAPLAAGLGVLTPAELESGTLVVDIGGGKTDLAIFIQGSIAYSACLPVGGQSVTNDLAMLLKTSPEDAEQLKIEHGGALARLAPMRTVEVQQIGQAIKRPLQSQVLFEIIESRMKEIARMVDQHVERSGFRGQLAGGAVLTGGGSLLPETATLFDEHLTHTKVRLGEPHLAQGPKFGKAVAIGLGKFELQCREEIVTATVGQDWREKVRSLWSSVSGKGN
ncbi:MAG: cell division protein FtsA [Fimbriimonas sp.]